MTAQDRRRRRSVASEPLAGTRRPGRRAVPVPERRQRMHHRRWATRGAGKERQSVGNGRGAEIILPLAQCFFGSVLSGEYQSEGTNGKGCRGKRSGGGGGGMRKGECGMECEKGGRQGGRGGGRLAREGGREGGNGLRERNGYFERERAREREREHAFYFWQDGGEAARLYPARGGPSLPTLPGSGPARLERTAGPRPCYCDSDSCDNGASYACPTESRRLQPARARACMQARGAARGACRRQAVAGPLRPLWEGSACATAPPRSLAMGLVRGCSGQAWGPDPGEITALRLP